MLLIPAGVLCFKFSQKKYKSGVVSLFKSILSAILLHTAWTHLFPNNFGMFQTSKHFLCKHFYENTPKCFQIILEYFDYSERFELFSNNFRIYETFIAIWIVWQTFFWNFLGNHFYGPLWIFLNASEFSIYSEHFDLFTNKFEFFGTFLNNLNWLANISTKLFEFELFPNKFV